MSSAGVVLGEEGGIGTAIQTSRATPVTRDTPSTTTRTVQVTDLQGDFDGTLGVRARILAFTDRNGRSAMKV